RPTTSASSTSSATSTSVVALANGLEVIAEVPEVDVSQIKLGQKVEISADAFPDQVFEGRVRLIAPEAVVEQNVTSFQVRVTVVTGKDKLRSGMNADAIFLGKQLENALVVPTVAIITNAGQTGVLVPDSKNKPRFQAVTIGITIGNQTQILEGLEPGELVFTDIPNDSQWAKPKQ
ncbi:MAG: HlyD family efflux transporter periplasmic adaptor subunit, partial [Leptolyngbyaceae cyanobacterium CRU_2_3]|nr:HlyD family efflux transporter periplasmic adaptor subunit [Leptolyngbyaceae cyanobacterium CRU_2_3]